MKDIVWENRNRYSFIMLLEILREFGDIKFDCYD